MELGPDNPVKIRLDLDAATTSTHLNSTTLPYYCTTRSGVQVLHAPLSLNKADQFVQQRVSCEVIFFGIGISLLEISGGAHMFTFGGPRRCCQCSLQGSYNKYVRNYPGQHQSV